MRATLVNSPTASICDARSTQIFHRSAIAADLADPAAPAVTARSIVNPFAIYTTTAGVLTSVRVDHGVKFVIQTNYIRVRRFVATKRKM